MSVPSVIAIVGAESTGKSTLARQLHAALAQRGEDVALVGEALRDFCEQLQRTPRRSEQQAIADEQTRRISDAARRHRIVVADTSALMIAVYSDLVFDDRGLYAAALRAHAKYTLTLLTALDLPWIADGLQRDGAHVRVPVDDRLRAALRRGGIAFSIVAGAGETRLAAALSACAAQCRPVARPAAEAPGPRWHSVCDRCGDADCERHLLARR